MTRDYNYRRRSAVFFSMLMLLAAQAAPAAMSQYDVEVIVFSNASAGSDDEIMDRPDAAGGYTRGAFPSDQFIELSSGEYRLNNIRGGLASARGYRVLYHRAWRQPAYDRSGAVDYPVHAQAAGASVDGTITLIKERYLHLDVDLLLREAAALPDGDAAPAFRLSEKRRIRSDELHYFDHPRFGVIARVTPYQSPDAATAGEPDAALLPAADVAPGGQEEEPSELAPADDQLTR